MVSVSVVKLCLLYKVVELLYYLKICTLIHVIKCDLFIKFWVQVQLRQKYHTPLVQPITV